MVVHYHSNRQIFQRHRYKVARQINLYKDYYAKIEGNISKYFRVVFGGCIENCKPSHFTIDLGDVGENVFMIEHIHYANLANQRQKMRSQC